MCGRFTREFTWREVHAFLSLPLEFLEQVGPAFNPSYNVAPSQLSPVCRADNAGAREVLAMAWGLRPPWIDKPGLAPINARSETVATSPMFRQAFKRRRCLIPASGFYEWKKDGPRKRPHYIQLPGAPILCFAGLWEARAAADPDDPAPLLTFTILTTRPNALMAEIHDRMPVILDPSRFDDWLTAETPDPGLFEPFPADRMAAVEVTTRVNSPKHNDPSLVRPAPPDALFD